VGVVVNQSLTSIVVSPGTITLADAVSQQFSATGKDQFGLVLLIQPSFTWTETAGSVGSTSGTGLYTAPSSGSGTATIQAAAGGLLGTAAVSVIGGPAAPANLTAKATSSSSIQLSWTGSSGATSYVIERSPNGSTGWTQIGTVSSATTVYSDSGLTASTTYYYYVMASSSSGTSSASNTASTTTMPAAPAAPTNLTAKAASSSKIALSWTGAAGATSYLVMRSLDGKTWTQVGTTTGGVTLFTDAGLAANTSYYYCIIGVNSGGKSPASNTAHATTLNKGK
jgi:hypothetical protein